MGGCLAASGSVTIDGKTDVAYTYDPLVNNVAKRTIQEFSTSAQKKMMECANCPYEMYQKFYNYYGQYDYANQIVLAALLELRPTSRISTMISDCSIMMERNKSSRRRAHTLSFGC